MKKVRRILIVDDDATFRTRLGRALSERQFEVHLADGADAALRIARAETLDSAVVDLRMDGPSGLELLKSLKRIQPELRVVILTGYGSIATAVEAMRLGATNYVSKPADVDDILATFEREPGADAMEDLHPPTLARMEWEFINRVLVECGGNVSEAARKLGMHRRTLQRKLAKLPPGEAPERRP
jgi:two-component system response regulator RegA